MDIEAIRRSAETPEVADAAATVAAADDLAAAFAADPMFDWLSRVDAGRDAARLGFFRHLMKELVVGSGQVLRPAGGGAAAVWMPSEKLGPNPLITELAALPMLVRLTGWSRFPRLPRLRAIMDKHHPMDRPHEYLWFLGVAPAAQGHGVGSRLMKARLDQLDAIGRPAFLETATEPNVRFYNRLGFQVIAEWRPAEDAPLNWSMWRDPAG